MDPLVQPSLMEARSQGQITPASHPYLSGALEAASGVVRDHCKWHIAPVVEETLRLTAVNGQTLWLPTGKLLEVVSLTDAGTAIDVAELDWDYTGEIGRTSWSKGLRKVEIRVRHGYESTPASVADLVLHIAARALGSPLGVVTEKALAASVTWTQTAAGVAGGTLIMPHEERILAPYRVGRTA